MGAVEGEANQVRNTGEGGKATILQVIPAKGAHGGESFRGKLWTQKEKIARRFIRRRQIDFGIASIYSPTYHLPSRGPSEHFGPFEHISQSGMLEILLVMDISYYVHV